MVVVSREGWNIVAFVASKSDIFGLINKQKVKILQLRKNFLELQGKTKNYQ